MQSRTCSRPLLLPRVATHPRRSPVAAFSSRNGANRAEENSNGAFKKESEGGSYDEATLSLLSLVGNTRYSKELTARQREIKQRERLGGESDSRGLSALGSAQWLEFLKYQYYKWRQDTVSDLQVFATVNFLLLLFLASIRAVIEQFADVDAGSAESGSFWNDFYQVAQLTFGEFNGVDITFLQQLFSLLVATIGLSAFALVLALVEQAFLESLEGNVKVGGKVYEEGHTLVLAFAQNTGELEVAVEMTQQICLAYSDMGGISIVVLSDIPKLEMEQHFRQAIPKHKRYGSCLIFRQGSPLVPEDLLLVNAPRAAATVIFSDNSRSPMEADAQALRTAVLLDELEFAGSGVPDTRTGHIIVEIQSVSTASLVNVSCSRRILPLPTYQMSARNMATVIKQPVVSHVSDTMWDFDSDSRGALCYYPELIGRTFQEVCFSFDEATPLAVVNSRTGNVTICPDLAYVMEPYDEIMMMRPRGCRRVTPLPTPIVVHDNWVAPCSARQFQKVLNESVHESEYCPALLAENGVGGGGERRPKGKSPQGLQIGTNGTAPTSARKMDPYKVVKVDQSIYVLPFDYNDGTEGVTDPARVLICGWKSTQFCKALLIELDHGQAALPAGSEVTFFNEHDRESSLDLALKAFELRRISVNHVQGDPLLRYSLRQLDIPSYKCAIVLSDDRWRSHFPGSDGNLERTGAHNSECNQSDLLRLDSLVMVAQLNIRKILQDNQHPDINIICEKLSFRGLTRFEDPCRLPMGTSVNFTSFGARLLALMAQNPKLMLPYSAAGEQISMAVMDSSVLCGKGEEVSYLQLVKRAHSVHRYILGFYQLPDRSDKSIAIVCNPVGAEFRAQPRVWNSGDGSCKLIVATPRELSMRDVRDIQEYKSQEAQFVGQWEAAIDLLSDDAEAASDDVAAPPLEPAVAAAAAKGDGADAVVTPIDWYAVSEGDDWDFSLLSSGTFDEAAVEGGFGAPMAAEGGGAGGEGAPAAPLGVQVAEALAKAAQREEALEEVATARLDEQQRQDRAASEEASQRVKSSEVDWFGVKPYPEEEPENGDAARERRPGRLGAFFRMLGDSFAPVKQPPL